MNSKALFPFRTLALILALLACVVSFSACKKSVSGQTVEETTEETVNFADENNSFDGLSQDLTVTDADPEELEQKLLRLPHLKKLTLEGKLPSYEKLLILHEKFPDLEMLFPVDFGGERVFTDAEVLDLSDTDVDPDALPKQLSLFSHLRELTLMETSLTDQEKMRLCDSLPGVLVRCELPLAGRYFPTDSTELDISGVPVTVAEVEGMLPYFPCLTKLDMSFCGISDAEMDALNQRHPEISIVWTVSIGMAKTRTDAVSFYPAGVNYYPTSEEMQKLRYCTELIAIDIGHTRATDCEFLWYTPKVKYLILADTGITDITPVGNLKDLIYLELFNLRIKDYAPLLNCTKLQDLNIGTTHADPEPLSKMTWLHNLQWHRADQDPATKEAVLKLPEQLPDTNVELYPKKKARNIGGPWRYLPNYYVFRDIIGADYFNQDQIGDYWGEEDGDRIMACNGGRSFAADTLAQIVRERIDKGEPIVGLKNTDSPKAEILYETLINAASRCK